MSMLYFWISYAIVTVIGILHTVFNIYVLHMKPMDSESMGEGYEKTKPWHPLYNIVLFSVFGYLYMRTLQVPAFSEALITGAIWAFSQHLILAEYCLTKTASNTRFWANISCHNFSLL